MDKVKSYFVHVEAFDTKIVCKLLLSLNAPPSEGIEFADNYEVIFALPSSAWPTKSTLDKKAWTGKDYRIITGVYEVNLPPFREITYRRYKPKGGGLWWGWVLTLSEYDKPEEIDINVFQEKRIIRFVKQRKRIGVTGPISDLYDKLSNNMKTVLERKYLISKGDQNLIKNLVHMAIEPFADFTVDSERKLVNTLLNDLVIFEGQMKNILGLLITIENRIVGKLIALEQDYDIENMPEHAPENSIIVRPKEFVKMIKENLNQQVRNVRELRKVLTTETNDEDDE